MVQGRHREARPLQQSANSHWSTFVRGWASHRCAVCFSSNFQSLLREFSHLPCFQSQRPQTWRISVRNSLSCCGEKVQLCSHIKYLSAFYFPYSVIWEGFFHMQSGFFWGSKSQANGPIQLCPGEAPVPFIDATFEMRIYCDGIHKSTGLINLCVGHSTERAWLLNCRKTVLLTIVVQKFDHLFSISRAVTQLYFRTWF